MIYYGHHLDKYNTDIEKYEIELINSYFKNAIIINPNGAINQNQDVEDIMNDCFNTIDRCDCLVFSSYSGIIGKGLYNEIKRAISKSKKIYYINENNIIPFDENNIEIIEYSNRIYAKINNIYFNNKELEYISDNLNCCENCLDKICGLQDGNECKTQCFESSIIHKINHYLKLY